jgi:hypothetical protein
VLPAETVAFVESLISESDEEWLGRRCVDHVRRSKTDHEMDCYGAYFISFLLGIQRQQIGTGLHCNRDDDDDRQLIEYL